MAAHLVMETEWSPKDADDDFQKLVLARSKYRVMIFAVDTGTERADGFERLIGHAGANIHAQAGDRYLMCCWNNENRGFEPRVYAAAQG